jgi:hypothetical protein
MPLTNNPSRMPAFARDIGPPAAKLTDSGRCSDCGDKAIFAGDGELKVCPKCYSVLWHYDWETVRREAKKQAALEATKVREEIFNASRKKPLRGRGVDVSSPEIESPELREMISDD